QKAGNHIVTSKIEHHAVLEPVEHLKKKEGFQVSYVGVDKDGIISPKDVEKALTKKTILVSVMMANNEIGTIQPIAEIGKIILKWRKKNNSPYPLFHTDACQAAGALDLDVEKLHVDLLTLNGSKIYGPKGVGVLYIRKGTKLELITFGGAQEMNKRPGTQNVAGIVGLAKALEFGQVEREKENARLIKLRDYFIGELLKIKGTKLNGHPEKRLPNNVNVSFLNIEGEAMILYFDAKGVYVSSGSACTSRTLDPSHVLMSTGVKREVAHTSVRFTLGKQTKKADLNYVLKVLPAIVKTLREISPTKFKYDK
nr:cysteine desulfurase [Phycisphaerae bacterium]